MDITQVLATELGIRPEQAQAAVKLIDEGNTIPFIARYRKEVTGSLDDDVLRRLDDRLHYLRNLEKRKAEVLASIDEQGKLTPELSAALAKATTLAEVEDLYRPYKPKRKTRASVAKEKGLEPLAEQIFAQNTLQAPLAMAEAFVNPEKGVETPQDALAGALDIIAENISDNAELRKALRGWMFRTGSLKSKAAVEEDTVYAMYYDFEEALNRIAGHRVLAIHRGEKESALKAEIVVNHEHGVELICKAVVTAKNACGQAVADAAADAYKRLLFPSLENEVRGALFETASEQAIRVFGLNLGHLLMQPPVKGHVVLGVDPGYRTGCKLAVVDATGKVLDTGVIYPTIQSDRKYQEAKVLVKKLVEKYGVEVISIGNGTASKETEMFVAEVIRELGLALSYMVVSEAGASVYSASKLASAEFPEYDVSLRSAVSIARRLQDPLAELVKIDPKAIGIGQYQHDMPPARLEQTLSGVVESCVNAVGVDLNTASFSLLEHVAGINAGVAKSIVTFREENGSFRKRSQLLKVPKLGKKAFEQCAGFLRITDGDDILDATAVHPESYNAAKLLLKLCGFSLQQVAEGNIAGLREKAQEIGLAAIAEQAGVGLPTINDIISELQKPGRDPRDELPPPMLRTDVMSLEDLKPEMVLTGTVRNVIDFGAFVDIGVHEDGLVHISRLCQKFVKHPSEVVKVGDIVQVKVLEVDVKKKRISLSMKDVPQDGQ